MVGRLSKLSSDALHHPYDVTQIFSSFLKSILDYYLGTVTLLYCLTQFSTAEVENLADFDFVLTYH